MLYYPVPNYPMPGVDSVPVTSRRGAARGVSRRALVAGLVVGGAVLAVGSGAAWATFTGKVPRWPWLARATPVPGVHVGTPIQLTGQAGAVGTLAWSPNGQLLAAGDGAEGVVRLWDVTLPNGPVATLAAPTGATGITDLSWARDSRYLLVSTTGAVAQIWNVVANTIIQHLPFATRRAVWHPRADVAALVADNTAEPTANGGNNVALWDIASGTIIGSLARHSGRIVAAEWSGGAADFLLATAGLDSVVIAWQGADVAHLAAVEQPLLQGAVNALAWSPQKTQLAVGDGSGATRVVERGGATVATLRRDGAAINAVAWSPDSALLATGAADGSVAIWRANGGLAGVLHTTGAVQSLAWTGGFLAAGTAEKVLSVWPIASGS